MNYSIYIPYNQTPPELWPAGPRLLAEPEPEYYKPPEIKRAYKRDDLLYKGIIESLFEDFITFMIPNAEQLIDFERGFDFMDKELQQLFPPEDQDYQPKVIDQLVKIYTKSGKEEWILIHIEFQNRYSKNFGERMFRYYARIFDKYPAKPITAFAIFTDATKIPRSNIFSLECLGTRLNYEFNVFKASTQDIQQLRESTNPFAKVFLITRSVMGISEKTGEERDAELLKVKIEVAKHLLAQNMPKEKIRTLINFLRYHTTFNYKTNNFAFEQKLNNITNNQTTMGLEELIIHRAEQRGEIRGKAKGEQNTLRETAKAMKEYNYPITEIIKITKLTAQEIEKL